MALPTSLRRILRRSARPAALLGVFLAACSGEENATDDADPSLTASEAPTESSSSAPPSASGPGPAMSSATPSATSPATSPSMSNTTPPPGTMPTVAPVDTAPTMPTGMGSGGETAMGGAGGESSESGGEGGGAGAPEVPVGGDGGMPAEVPMGGAAGSGGAGAAGTGGTDAEGGAPTAGAGGAGGAGGAPSDDCPGAGDVTYQFNDVEAWPSDALERITPALDEAISYYNCYSNLTHSLTINYNPGVPTAEANVDGWISFGSDRNYMVVATVMHEIGHTMGVGYFPWGELLEDGRWIGQNVVTLMSSIPPEERDDGDGQRDYITADSQHFWPYGLNYASEHESEWSLINHVRIVDAMNRDKDEYGR